MRWEATLRAEVDRLQRRIEYHECRGDVAGKAIAGVYRRMLGVKRARLVGTGSGQ